MFERQKIEVDALPPVVRHKWGKELLTEGFVPFPKRLLRTLATVFGKPDFEILQVILAVADFARPNLRQSPSVSYLAFLAGLDEGTFMQRLTELTNAGLVDWTGENNEITVSLSPLIGVANQRADETNPS